MKKRNTTFVGRGFTLLELLVVIAIVAVFAVIILVATSTTKAKAEDTKTKETLAQVRTTANVERTEPTGFTPVCQSGEANTMINNLAASRGLSTTEYGCAASKDDFAVTFPLKAEDGYWCVDAEGKAQRVLAKDGGSPGNSQRCADIAASVPAVGATPVVTLSPICPNPYLTTGDCSSNSCARISWNTSFRPTVIANDAEDGNITASLQYTVDQVPISQPANQAASAATYNAACNLAIQPGWTYMCLPYFEMYHYTVTDSDGNSSTLDVPMYNCYYGE